MWIISDSIGLYLIFMVLKYMKPFRILGWAWFNLLSVRKWKLNYKNIFIRFLCLQKVYMAIFSKSIIDLQIVTSKRVNDKGICRVQIWF